MNSDFAAFSKFVLEHPMWDVIGVVLAVVTMCKILHPDIKVIGGGS
jgi:hypothetical protein